MNCISSTAISHVRNDSFGMTVNLTVIYLFILLFKCKETMMKYRNHTISIIMLTTVISLLSACQSPNGIAIKPTASVMVGTGL